MGGRMTFSGEKRKHREEMGRCLFSRVSGDCKESATNNDYVAGRRDHFLKEGGGIKGGREVGGWGRRGLRAALFGLGPTRSENRGVGLRAIGEGIADTLKGRCTKYKKRGNEKFAAKGNYVGGGAVLGTPENDTNWLRTRPTGRKGGKLVKANEKGGGTK